MSQDRSLLVYALSTVRNFSKLHGQSFEEHENDLPSHPPEDTAVDDHDIDDTEHLSDDDVPTYRDQLANLM